MLKKHEKPENPQKNMIKFLTIFDKNRDEKCLGKRRSFSQKTRFLTKMREENAVTHFSSLKKA
jgi:hypothetical protein